jgi:3-phenylpropionate/trans-cinnamate dioxygenase ferredoxin subunit
MGTVASVEALKTADLNDGEMREVNIQGHEILIARAGGSFYAASNRCPHMGAKLSHGKLDGTVVTCPRHGSQFDLKDGQVIRWTKWTGVVASAVKLIKSPRPIQVYPVKVEGDRVLIEV